MKLLKATSRFFLLVLPVLLIGVTANLSINSAVTAVPATDIAKVDPGKTGIPKIKIEVLVANILNIFYFAIGVVSVIVIIIAGFTMVTSGHNPTSVAKARNAILFASIGIIIVIGAFAMTQFIVGRF